MGALTPTYSRKLAVTSIGLALIALSAAALSYALLNLPYDRAGALIVGPLLLVAAAPAAQRAARTNEDAGLVWVLMAGLALKLLASTVRWIVTFDVYDGVADAAGYSGAGSRLAAQIRQGDLDLAVEAPIPGTGALQVVTAVVYSLIGPTSLGGFYVFASLAYYGQYMLYRAFRIGVPSGDHRRYAYLVLLFPSMLYWPSSIGKEAWIVLGLGLSSFGFARLLSRSGGALVPLAAGIASVAFVRPHIAMLLFASLLPAYLWPQRRRRPWTLQQRLAWALNAALIIGATLIVLTEVQQKFGIEGLSQTDVAFNETARRTTQGGSRFAPNQVRSPGDLPQSLVTVLFRPFPYEAHNLQTLMAAGETSLLLMLVFLARGRVLRLPAMATQHPYVRFATGMTLLSAVAFSYVGNFGILARQRVQYLPFFLVLLALPVGRRVKRHRGRPAELV